MRMRVGVGWLLLILGLAVFGVRVHHAGPYAFPRGGNLAGGLLALASGLWLVRAWPVGQALARPLSWAVLAASPIVFYLAAYATLAELEEVVVLRTAHDDLRLWIVDHEGAAWVNMPRWKAEANALSETRVELLRDGETRCVIARRFDDHQTADKVHQLRHGKYRVQRLATALGLFRSRADKDMVSLQLTPCPRPG